MTLSDNVDKHDISNILGTAKLQKQNPSIDVSKNLKLKSVFHISHSNELSSTFCLQSCDDFVVLKSKGDMGVMRLENQPGYHVNKFQISSRQFENSTYNVVETLKVNEKQIFKSLNNSERNDAMLSNVLFPSCIPKNPTLIKCHISPNTQLLTPITASLSSLGSLQLSKYHHDIETNETSLQSIVEFCEIRKTSFSLGTYVKYNKLREIVEELMFYDFEWCPAIIDSKRFLVAMTRSREIIFYSISTDNVVLTLYSKKLDKLVNTIKWIVHGERHFLFSAGAKGLLTKYSIEINDAGVIEDLVKVSEMEGKLRIPISSIESVSSDEFLILVASKSHSVEIFCDSMSLTKYVGMNITGVATMGSSPSAFLISTIDNEIFYLEVTKNDDEELTISKFEKVEITTNSTIQPEKFGAYGIAASKNNALVYIALYPQTITDHLTLKQPLHVTVNLFSGTDPYKMLMENESLRLTEFQDCVEAVRFVGTSKLETMSPLSAMDYEIGLTDDFAYYLKIQLLVTNAKLVFYKTRSETIFEVTEDTQSSIKKIIEVIYAYKILKRLSPTKKLSKISQLSIRCLSNFINCYINEEMIKQPFLLAQQTFEKDLIEVLIAVNKSESLKGLKNELCYYCEESIDADKLTCSLNHQPVRCSITKLQLPAIVTSCCPRCNCNVMDLITLKEVTESDEQLCLYCDGHILFV